ncbi:hypothetical protein GCM10023340_06860 [Nocardioides marinquilinus]|uniref:Uncharacterized protein n=1 Tax=Nocardioides marinquilinus TaxID=1210400 RepID=A0ABP9PAY1_9ACTN
MSATFRTRVLARVPAPGHPAYVHAHTNGRVYAGNYVAGGDDRRASRVFEWRADGTLLRSWTVPGQRLDGTQGVQVAEQTHDGRLVLLETSTRSVLTLDVATGRFRRVARLPAGAVPNYATWGPAGLLVTDYAQGTIWRVGRRGRVSAWLTSPALDGVDSFGTTGIRFHAGRVLVTQQTTPGATPTQGHLYEVPVRGGRPGELRTLWTSRPGDLPDGFGLGRSGRFHVACVGPSNQLVVLSRTGRELRRFPEVPLTGENGSAVPFDGPCNATFQGRRLLVANQAVVSGDASHMAVLTVDVGEPGTPPHRPRSATFTV